MTSVSIASMSTMAPSLIALKLSTRHGRVTSKTVSPSNSRVVTVNVQGKSEDPSSKADVISPGRRNVLGAAILAAGAALSTPHAAFAKRDDDDDYTRTASGLRIFDAKLGTGEAPKSGDKVVVHWAGYTSGYQGKRIENTSKSDDPYVFTLGKHEVFPAFEEAVLGMNVGGLRRIEIPGEIPELGYPIKRSERFTDGTTTGTKYRYGPQPSELGGQRALDFVLDNPTLQPFNRTLVYDIRLLNIRK